MKILFLLFIYALSLYAKVDYSTMSTEELLVMMGYVPKENIKAFREELDKRVGTMNKKEKKIYLKNLKKRKK